MKEDRSRFVDLAKLGPALHAACPRSTKIGDACVGVSRLVHEGLVHDCATCGIAGTLLIPTEIAS